MDDQATKPAEDNSMPLLRVEKIIKSHLAKINKISEEISKHKEMVDDGFANDQIYQEHDKIAKAAGQVRSKTKSEIIKRPGVANLVNAVKTLKLEKKELQEGLADYLKEYQRLSGSNQFQGEDGEVREIILITKLVKKSKYRP